MNISPLDIHNTETTQSSEVGTVYRIDSVGKSYRYAENGGTAAGAGKLMVAATQTANHVNLSFASAPAAGDNYVSVTLGATAATAGDYANGQLVVQDGTGEGIAYDIEGHPAADASASLRVDLKKEITVAGAVSETNVDLVKNLWKDVVISVTDQADPIAGVFNVAVAANAYGMIQTWGPAAVWQDEANAVGASLTTGTGVAGQVETVDAAGEHSLGQMGTQVGVATEYQLVFLQIAY